MEKIKIQKYLNNFRRRISPYLKRNIGITANIYPYSKGVVILLEFGENSQNNDEYKQEYGTAGEILNLLDINAFGEATHSINFRGTNTVMFNNIVVFIKDQDEKEWNDRQAQKDVNMIVQPSKTQKV